MAEFPLELSWISVNPDMLDFTHLFSLALK